MLYVVSVILLKSVIKTNSGSDKSSCFNCASNKSNTNFATKGLPDKTSTFSCVKIVQSF